MMVKWERKRGRICCGKRQGCEKWADFVLLVTQDHSDMQAFTADYGHDGSVMTSMTHITTNVHLVSAYTMCFVLLIESSF